MSKKRRKSRSTSTPVTAAAKPEPVTAPATPEEDRPAVSRSGTSVLAWTLFVALLLIYNMNGDFLIGNTTRMSTFLPVSVLKEGNVSVTPEEAPHMFGWVLAKETGVTPVRLSRWSDQIDGRHAKELYDEGLLSVHRQKYYIIPTEKQGVYVGVRGPGSAVCHLPVATVLHVLTGDLAAHPKAMWYGAKLTASLFVAGSAVCVFLIGCRFLNRRKALALSLAYGLGTAVWAVSSQALWQHGPAEFFVALGSLLLLQVERKQRRAVWCGCAYAAAAACQPSMVVVLVVAGAYLVLRDRKAVVWYVVGIAPLVILFGFYNTYYFGMPWRFSQTAAGVLVAESKGERLAWSGRIWGGALGLLFSPSRGVLFFSPFVLLSFWGMWLSWRRREFVVLRALGIAALGLMLVAFAWFDWWGGWTYAYRPIVDAMPLMVLLLIPVTDLIWQRKAALAVCGVLVIWSVYVQVLGAFAFNMVSWNARFGGYSVALPSNDYAQRVSTKREAEELVRAEGAGSMREIQMNIDKTEYRYRLWSLRDNPIHYYTARFRGSRRFKKKLIRQWLGDPGM